MGNVSFVLIDSLTSGNESGEGYVPNTKTGVAYGLLKSRDGSSIMIVKNHETDALQQSRFHYYLGRDRRHCFDCRFSPAEIAYKKWVPFQKASKSVVRIYYTNNPMTRRNGCAWDSNVNKTDDGEESTHEKHYLCDERLVPKLF